MGGEFTMSGDHYTEIFLSNGDHLQFNHLTYGWQCFTCDAEQQGFWFIKDAEASADRHHAENHTSEDEL